jgi:hypothetical protein
MKITLEPTIDLDYPSCSISIPNDDLSINDLFERLINPALLGIGYYQKSINEYYDSLAFINKELKK